MHNSPEALEFSPCVATECRDDSCTATCDGLSFERIILKTDSDTFRELTGTRQSRMSDFAVVVHEPAYLLMVELRGHKHKVERIHQQLQNALSALAPRLRVDAPIVRAGVFASGNHKHLASGLRTRFLLLNGKRIPIKCRRCGDRLTSLILR